MSFIQEFNLEQIRRLLLTAHQTVAKPIERRLYYDEAGNVITYTCEDLPGDYIIVTPEQFAEARPDVKVRDGQLIYTHKLSHISKMAQSTTGVATSDWDVNILVDRQAPEKKFWSMKTHVVS